MSWSARSLAAGMAKVLTVAVLGVSPCVFALPAQYSVTQLHHMQWRAQDGVPTGIEAIAQTPDGFLWLGTSGGLFRFDGVSFERFTGVGDVRLLSQDIYALHVAADGGLWIGHHLGGVSHLHEGRLVNYGVAEGLPRSSVSALAKAGDGTVWAGTTRGPFRLEGGRWRAAGAAWGAPGDPVDGFVLDRDRTLWMMSNDSVYFLPGGGRHFERLPISVPRSNYQTLLRHPDGTAMVCTSERLRTLTLTGSQGRDAKPLLWIDHGQAVAVDSRCAFDRDGHLWFGGAQGAGRIVPKAANADRSVRAQRDADVVYKPLYGTSVSAILEDREGNLWFASRGGLDRFRAPTLLTLPLDAGSFEFALAPAGDDAVWIGSSLGSVFHFQPPTQPSLPSPLPRRISFDGLKGAGLDTLFSSPAGELWLAGGDALWRPQSGQRWQRLARGEAPTRYTYASIQAMTQDAQGALWVSVLRAGAYRVVGSEWQLHGGRTDMPGHNVTALFTDARGRVWFGHDDGAVLVLDGERLDRVVVDGKVPPPETLGSIEAFAEHAGQFWIGSEKGLWRLDGGTVRPVTGSRGPFIGVTGLAPLPSGDLWMSTMEGVVHIAADEVARAIRDDGHAVAHEVLNHLDGLPGVPDGAMSHGGRVWISTANGVVWTDPAHRPRNTIAPVAVVTSVVADGVVRAIAPGDPIELAPRTHDLTIAFTAPSLTMPERVRFRYRLFDEGDDAHAEWQDAGVHREISFRDLAPGRYRFEIIAANNDGLWGATGATGANVTVVIPPTFVQTVWFKALCALAAIAALWLLLALRVRAVKHRLRLRMEERLVERERIARELHDTLLQAVQGLVLRFDAAMAQVPPAERERGMLREALDHADEVIADGRDAVTNLRATDGASMDLARDLQLLGERWSRDTGMDFSMRIDGPAARLDPIAMLECQRIMAEALSNAFRHSGGTRVRLHIDHTTRRLRLSVGDDGRGFDPGPAHEGRWGLIGMRERAQRLHGRLSVASGGEGSVVTLEVPARVAYQRRRRGGIARWLRRRPVDDAGA